MILKIDVFEILEQLEDEIMKTSVTASKITTKTMLQHDKDYKNLNLLLNYITNSSGRSEFILDRW